MSFKVAYATHKQARMACSLWHYSKTVPTPPLVKFGVWEEGKFIGVVLFSRGASGNLGTRYGLKKSEVAELTRVALTKHKTEVTKIISVCIKMLKRMNPGLKKIISFADPEQGHTGQIYKAGNWTQDGVTAQSVEYYDKSGRKWHSRQVSEKGYNIQYGEKRLCKKPSQLTKKKLKGKHRFFYDLDRRATSKDNVALTSPGQRGRCNSDRGAPEMVESKHA